MYAKGTGMHGRTLLSYGIPSREYGFMIEIWQVKALQSERRHFTT